MNIHEIVFAGIFYLDLVKNYIFRSLIKLFFILEMSNVVSLKELLEMKCRLAKYFTTYPIEC